MGKMNFFGVISSVFDLPMPKDRQQPELFADFKEFPKFYNKSHGLLLKLSFHAVWLGRWLCAMDPIAFL